MPTLNEIQDRIVKRKSQAQDEVRREYLRELAEYTGRDTILYASAFTSTKGLEIPASALSVMPDDLLKKLTPEQTKDLLTFLLTPGPSMPRDYIGAEKRPKPRTVAEVNAVLAGAPNPPEKTRPIRVVLVAGAKDHGPGEHDYPAWLKAWGELLRATDNIEVVTAAWSPAPTGRASTQGAARPSAGAPSRGAGGTTRTSHPRVRSPRCTSTRTA